MKKVLKIVMIVLIVFLLAFAAYFGYKSYLDKRNPVDVVKEFSGDVKERREYVFQPQKVKEVNDTVNPDSNPRIIQLYLGNNKYYQINVPAEDIVLTDYSTYVYEVNSKYGVQVMKGITKDNMSAMFSMKNVENLTHTIIKTKDGRKEPQAVGVLLVDDLGIVATCYDNSFAFATILRGIEENRVKNVKYESPKISEDCNTYALPSQIPTNEVYNFSVSPNDFNEAGTKQFNFNGGQLTQFSLLLGFDDAISEMYNRINVATFGDAIIKAQCNTDGVKYIEVGDFTMLVNMKTVNKSNCLLGQGAEARYNIITYYRQYCN